jgi:hypothetical protein
MGFSILDGITKINLLKQIHVIQCTALGCELFFPISHLPLSLLLQHKVALCTAIFPTAALQYRAVVRGLALLEYLLFMRVYEVSDIDLSMARLQLIDIVSRA